MMFILLNGPPKSGRSELASALYRRLPNSVATQFSFPLKDFFVAALAQPWDQLDSDTAKAVLNGRSGVDAIRQLRTHIRAVYGPDAFGRWLEHRVLGQAVKPNYVIVDDALFPDDIARLAAHKCVLVRVRRDLFDSNFTPLPNPDYTFINQYHGLGHVDRAAAEMIEKGLFNV